MSHPAHPDAYRHGPARTALVAVAVATTALTLAVPPAAEAHVRVTADSTTGGSGSTLTLRVPNESADTTTTRVSLQLPADTPFVSVRSRVLPGWRVVARTAKLPKPVPVNGTTLTEAVRTLTWTAAPGAGIGPDQYQDFTVAVSPLPPGGTLLLPVRQTYSDGTVVSWDEPTPASGEEPEHPAPTLTVLPVDPPVQASPPPTTTALASTTDVPARGLGGVGLLLGVAGTALALVSLRRRRPAGTAS